MSAIPLSVILAVSVSLPLPDLSGGKPLHRVLAERRSVREYADVALDLQHLGALLWAAQGITSPDGLRTCPSAGALYPLSLYVAVRAVEGLEPGVFGYQPEAHSLQRLPTDYVPLRLWAAALEQPWVKDAPVVLVVAGAKEKTEAKYGTRATQYVLLEAGHAAQNVLLEAVSLGLGAVPVGAFVESEVQQATGIPEEPLLLIPVGRPR